MVATIVLIVDGVADHHLDDEVEVDDEDDDILDDEVEVDDEEVGNWSLL